MVRRGANPGTGERALSRVGQEVSGKYRLEALLGVGGTAAVYAARHRNGHRVALKMLHRELSLHEEIRARFLREGYIGNAVGHASVVRIVDDSVAEDGTAFLVLDLLEGESLGGLLKRGHAFAVHEVLAVADAILDVLECAHRKGIVHRDLKPENLFLCTDGRFRVLDFGVARQVLSTGVTSTAAGSLLGTPAFMAPEQALGRGREIGPRTDIWAVGATMFTLLTGRHVHDGEYTEEVLIYAATRNAPPLASVAPDSPREVCQILDRALAFDADDRWADAASMRAAVREVAQLDGFRPLVPGALVALAQRLAPRSGRAVLPDGSSDKELGGPPRRDPTKTELAATLPSGASVNERLGETSSSDDAPSEATRVSLERATWRAALRAALPGPALIVVAALMAAACLGVVGILSARRAHVMTGAHGMDAVNGDAGSRRGPEPLWQAPGCNPAATAAMAAGMQLWRDASQLEAIKRFDEASTVDPTCAVAHVRYVAASPWPHPAALAHLHRAEELRSLLSSREAAILDAVAPDLDEPPSYAVSAERLHLLAVQRDDDWLRILEARRITLARRPADAARLLGEVFSREKDAPPYATYLLAKIRAERGDLDGARSSFGSCLRQSPSSADCLYWSGEMASNLGRCAESEDYARRLIISAPSSPGGYELLAGALYWSHGTEEARAALEQRWQRVPESERAAVVLADEFVLAALKSDWPAAENFVQQWAVAVKSAGQDLSSGRPILRQIELLMELDRGREARELADRYVHLSRAWSADIVQDFFIDVLRLKYRAGGMTRDEWRRERDQWLESKKRSYWSGFADMRWLSAYAGIDEPDEESRAHFPEEKPIVSILAVEPDVLDDIGKSLLAWGRTDEAIESFALGARSCTIEFPLASMRAHFHLGQAYEAKGDVSSACTEYSALSARFRGTRTTALARDRVKVLGCNRADASLN